MPTVRLSDAFIPEVFASYQTQDAPELTAFAGSGVIVSNELLSAAASSGGSDVTIPYWNDLDANTEPNISNDDPADEGDTMKIGSDTQEARVAYLNQGFSSMDLVAELAGSDPMQRIRSRVDTYWGRQFQRRLISTVVGVFNANVAQNAGDMVEDISSQTPGTVTAANMFSRSAFVEACFTLGDEQSVVNVVAVHSVIYKKMVDNDDIEFIPDSQGNMTIPTYLGKRVIVDDSMPTFGAGIDRKYLSVLFGSGAIGYGSGNPGLSEEVDRKPGAGNGSGQEILWTRRTWLMHPAGYRFNASGGSALAGLSASNAELRTAAKWSRRFERKNVPLAFLLSNG